MRPWIALLPVSLLLALSGCQRLPGDEDGGADDSSPPAPTSDGGTFIPQDTGPDDEGEDETGTMGSCDPVAQIGCAMDEKCTAILSGGQVTYACVADPGGLDPTSPCNASHEDGIDGCPAGYACLADEGDNGLCVALCDANADCVQGECVEARESAIPYCADDCSPFGSQCPAPLQCRRNGNRFSCRFLGLNDVGGQGEPCAVEQDAGCAPGLVCVPGALVPECTSDNCCTVLCDLTDPNPCPSPSSCNAILTGPAPGFEDIGACFVPA